MSRGKQTEVKNKLIHKKEFDKMKNELCVVDTKNFWIYNFANDQEQAEETLTKAIEANKKDIET